MCLASSLYSTASSLLLSILIITIPLAWNASRPKFYLLIPISCRTLISSTIWWTIWWCACVRVWWRQRYLFAKAHLFSIVINYSITYSTRKTVDSFISYTFIGPLLFISPLKEVFHSVHSFNFIAIDDAKFSIWWKCPVNCVTNNKIHIL